MFGTNTTLDNLTYSNQTVFEFGEDRAFDAIDDAFRAQNEQLMEQMAVLCRVTTSNMMRAATPDSMVMQKLSEFGTPTPQKVTAGAPLGFPLDKYGGAWQITYTAMKTLPARVLAANTRAMMTADKVNIQAQIKQALYKGTNYSFNDYLVDQETSFPLPVKALANADSFALPLGPNGETFVASTHNHYLATIGASLAAADYDALIATVREHFSSGTPCLYINVQEEAFVRAMTGFYPLFDGRTVQSTTTPYAVGTYNFADQGNTMIGIYKSAEVWVKPWVIAGYPICFQKGQLPPLAFRERAPGSGGLQLVFEDEVHPLRARVWEREFGVGVWNRVNAAVLDTTHQTTYVAPTVLSAAA